MVYSPVIYIVSSKGKEGSMVALFALAQLSSDV